MIVFVGLSYAIYEEYSQHIKRFGILLVRYTHGTALHTNFGKEPGGFIDRRHVCIVQIRQSLCYTVLLNDSSSQVQIVDWVFLGGH